MHFSLSGLPAVLSLAFAALPLVSSNPISPPNPTFKDHAISGQLISARQFNGEDPLALYYYAANFTAAHANGSYAPEVVACPTMQRGWVRDPGPAKNISIQEREYMNARRSRTNNALQSVMRALNISVADIPQIFNGSNAPVTAIAFSGGGYRSMLNGAGIYRALDNRTQDGPAGGFLQAMDYIAGTSGGAWLVGSSAVHNFATVDNLNHSVWRLDRNLITGDKSGGNALSALRDAVKYFIGIWDQVRDKADAGFNTGLTDYWSLALGRQLINHENASPNTVWSNITLNRAFIDKQMPFPIVVADGRRADEAIAPRNSTIYEFNPFEFGTWDANQTMFFPMRYIGTNMSDGHPVNTQRCVTKFDSAAYVLGTSSSFFNRALAEQLQYTNRSDIGSLLEDVEGDATDRIDRIRNDALAELREDNFDLAQYPNPFRNYKTESNPTAKQQYLSLTDGGSDGQNLPLIPLIQPSRQVDFILAVDSSSDTPTNYPNGSAIYQTYERVMTNYTSLSFPYVPPPRTFVAEGLNRRPTFFGCNPQNLTGPSNTTHPGPLIVYLPNTPINYYSNASTYAANFTHREISGFLDNAEAQLLTPLIPDSANTSSPHMVREESFLGCLACAMVQRSKVRAGVPQGPECDACFRTWCWDGSLTTRGGGYEGLGNGSRVAAGRQEGQGRGLTGLGDGLGGGRMGGEGFWGRIFGNRWF